MERRIGTAGSAFAGVGIRLATDRSQLGSDHADQASKVRCGQRVVRHIGRNDFRGQLGH